MSEAADADAAVSAADADAAASTGTAGDVIDTNGVSVISSLCVACEARGETRLLLLKIPFFRDIILAAFSCEACGELRGEAARREAGVAARLQWRGQRTAFAATRPYCCGCSVNIASAWLAGAAAAAAD